MKAFCFAVVVLFSGVCLAADGGAVVEDDGSNSWTVTPANNPETSGLYKDYTTLEVVPDSVYEGTTPDSYDPLFTGYPKRVFFKDGSGSWTSNYVFTRVQYKLMRYDYGNTSWESEGNWQDLDDTFSNLQGPISSSSRDVSSESTTMKTSKGIAIEPLYSVSEVAAGRPVAKVKLRYSLRRYPNTTPKGSFQDANGENGYEHVQVWYAFFYDNGSGGP